ncbi:TIGR02444 family protein [Sneathiella limimaris]|uniref:TIGR02444 family protein n=1 Tax=Sneathiella limimaris TaxID=1964213 RepID=UPI00146A1307|nr:TIGR02444 family protein [Sneathiella limimaris]
MKEPSEIAGFDEFWQYCLRLYDSEGVKEAVLKLQDQLELDVCVLLFACWSANQSAGGWNVEQLKRIKSVIHNWQYPVVSEIRKVRTFLKESELASIPHSVCSELRTQLLQLELEAEKAELHSLFLILAETERDDTEVASLQCQVVVAEKNILAAHGLEPDHGLKHMRPAFQVLFASAFEVSQDEVAGIFERL